MEPTNKPKPKKPRRRDVQLRQRAEKFKGWWPDLFDLTNVKPLKLGIDQDLLADAQARGIDLPMEHIKRFLARWTQRHAYWSATLKGEYRHGLNGETIPITDVDRNYAKGWAEGAKAQFYESNKNHVERK